MSVCVCVCAHACVSIDPPRLLSAAASIFSYCSDSVEKRESSLLLLPYWMYFIYTYYYGFYTQYNYFFGTIATP